MTFRPLLAAEVKQGDEHKLVFPVLASPKLDGIRVLVRDGVARMRSLKPVPNKRIQEALGRLAFEGLDGEVISGDPCDKECFSRSTSAVRAEHSQAPFKFHVFDNFLHPSTFEDRWMSLLPIVDKYPELVLVPHTRIFTLEELNEYEKRILDMNYEGVMLRSIDGPYKYGRSTFREGTLLKLKRGQVKNGDAEIIGFKERMHNENEATRNELGLQERSSHKDGKKGRNDLGSLLVRDTDTGHEFAVGIGPGLNDALRKEIWDNQENYLGKIIRYEWFAYGDYNLPRFPKFIAFRDPGDMS